MFVCKTRKHAPNIEISIIKSPVMFWKPKQAGALKKDKFVTLLKCLEAKCYGFAKEYF